MVKKILIIAFLSILLILFFVSEINKPKSQSWQLNFSGISKDPFGCYVLRETLDNHHDLHFLKTTNSTFFSILPNIPDSSTSTILVITDDFNPDSINLSSVYSFVNKGNNLFISSYSFNKKLKDSLKFEIDYVNHYSFNKNSDTINLENPRLKFYKPIVYNEIEPINFTRIDTVNHWILGTNRAGYADYIKVPYGKGAFYLHCQPLVFTNYHLLYSNKEYPYNALSYFKNTKLIWDNYYKPIAGKYTMENQTPFRYFLSQQSLRISLYLTLLLIAIYFFIESKRKQRLVPVVQPLQNSTIKFVVTIARLYQGQPDYKKMAAKKYLFLKEMVYSRYMIRLDEKNTASASQFAEKTGYDLEKIKELYIIYRRIESSISINAETLITFSKQVDEIYEFEKGK